MEITLRIKGEDKTFTQNFVKFKIKREALDIEKYAQNPDHDPIELLDRQFKLIVEAFDKQFTKTDLENGLNTIGHMDVIYDIIGVNILGYPSREELEKRAEEADMGKLLEKLIAESQSTKQ
ncbi:hypothetical protein ACH95_19130 [Bacillus glycinifermentans]|uniref:phage tail assembly chaperone G n=1 Tax=Bacillus TaxID=1386 RepID=UPI000653E59C|nr:hypothetical protein [Bacillus glycinifermentans]KMM55447.1 hypothetical protein ACH95_19130 [Bacillus glycinifermentans]MEC0497245.1 hypothetical protein [Bacillus glycinifermentans]MEC0540764.1 hypothetical protein [Bacillus glycinifermentans]